VQLERLELLEQVAQQAALVQLGQLELLEQAAQLEALERPA